MQHLIKFYADSDKYGANFLFTFKVKDRFEAVDAVPRIVAKFDNVRAIFYVNDKGTSFKIYSKKS